ncbi:MAG: response regulator [Myxococcales bacterium]|nr:response regulator [Myxococcales bacterium]
MPEPRYTILAVDDEADVRDIVARSFERRYNVFTAASGAEALAILRSKSVDLLITDQKMPEMTGVELVAAARAGGIDITAILLTAYTDPQDIIAAINRGQVYRYLTKPWDVNELLITVRNALEYVQLRRDKDRLLAQTRKRVEALSVLYEVSHQSAGDTPTYDAIIDRVLTAVGRVLPHDCGAALVAVSESRTATLRLRCNSAVSDKGLLAVKETVLAAHRKSAGVLLPEDRIVTRVSGNRSPEPTATSAFASELTVPLVASGKPVGTLSLFSTQVGAYSAEDGELLDVLANQTTDAIQSLRASEDEARRRIERMVEAMADGVLLTDEKNEVLVINSATRRVLGLASAEELTGRHLQETLGFTPFELVRNWEYGGAQVIREELKLRDRTIHTTISPVAGAGGSLRGVVVVLRDITEQKLLEERKDEFVSMVSHELRTPLTSITGALDLVLNQLTGSINERQARYLGMARESAEKLNAIVDDLLDLSKFAKGRLRMNFEVCHLDDLVQRAVEKYGAAFLEKRIRASVQLPEKPLRVLADPNRLHQVLNNLLTNAVKFAPEGGELQVHLRGNAAAPGFATLSMWNSGDPIPEGDLERIFDKFEQARTNRTRTVRGTGLGLAISRSIVESHGGRIWAEPCSDGARFVAVLPVEPAPELVKPEGEAPRPAQSAMRGTVLVVEDEAEIAYILKAMLLPCGYRATIARNAEEALAIARKIRPDMITLDVRLPDVDGLRLAEIFRHDPDTSSSPLVVISAFDERERAFKAGVSAFLQKPIETDKLRATIESLVRGRLGKKQGRALVIDDDPAVRSICEEVLRNSGYEVEGSQTLAEAREAIRVRRPDVLLLDIVMPDGDGLVFFEELKAERASSRLSVIFISAKTETSAKIRALKLGGDDYLTKPFDALELVARVESVMRRKEREFGASPTTQLPGSAAIEREVSRRLAEQRAFAFCYLDLDNLKAYNDYYGFAKADGVVRQTGDLMREIIAQAGAPSDFLGHVAGDDFVFVTEASTVDAICQSAIEAFDRIIPLYYDRQDRERGYIEAEDRFGERRRFPIMSVSIAAVMCDGASADHSELARLAADLKKRAKAVQGSVYLRSDRVPKVRSAAG